MHRRNPWQGISDWKEFQYDVRHPILWLKRARAGLGLNPGTVLVIVGLANMVVGFLLILHSSL